MAQQKRKKKKRSRHDPTRREAARRREEARQQAAEERRRQQEAEERRSKLKRRTRRLVIPVLGTIAVFVVALTLFRPPPELDGVASFASPNALMSELGYQGEWTERDPDLLPAPQCGRTDEALPGIEAYSSMYNGLITLWYQPDGEVNDEEIWAALSEIDNYNQQVLVAPNTAIEAPVVAASWNRLAEYENTENLADYVQTYLRHRGPGREACLAEFAEAGSILVTYGYAGDWASTDPDTMPEPMCGQSDATITGAEIYSALYNGAVILWHASDDQNTIDKLIEIASTFESQVLVVPNDNLQVPVLAVAWNRAMAFENTDRVADFIGAYQHRGPGDAECPAGFAGGS